MPKHLVFVGGGHAHLTALKRLRDTVGASHRVTLIGPSRYHYYSGMGPGLLSGIYRPAEARFHVKKMAEDRGAMFIEERVVLVDPVRRTLVLGSGAEVRYDAVSFNTGSEVPLDLLHPSGDNVFPVKPIENLLAARRKIQEADLGKRLCVVVVGGGTAAVEIAANLGHLARETGRIGGITLVSRSHVLGDFPAKARTQARGALARWGVESIEGIAAESIADGVVRLENGANLAGDMVFVAIGIRPSPLFRDSGLPTGEDGGLLVNDYLQCVDHPELFGGGDCISLAGSPLARVGVYAVRQNRPLHRNLLAFLEGRPLQRFDPGGDYLLILNLGDRNGLFRRKEIVWSGRLAFWLKDYLDRRFMRKFQVSGELRELLEE
ncbi:MAG TPA: FAD-dependent oxidoreductase [Candidatus Limnocylindrales bacterium]|nr:FAD-dependent oxidoreductase [Candidatus Limnocylindrales bacterium]